MTVGPEFPPEQQVGINTVLNKCTQEEGEETSGNTEGNG